MYVVQCRGQDRTFGMPAWITLHGEFSPFTETMNVLSKRKYRKSLIKLIKNSVLNHLYQARVPCNIKGFFDMLEYHSYRHI